MILCVDCGNTNISFGIFTLSGEFVKKFEIKTEKNLTAFEFFVKLKTIFSHFNLKDITQVKIASVVPEVERPIAECFTEVFNIKNVSFITQAPIKINLDIPEEVGIDRLINVFAALTFYGVEKNVLIIDFGTAVTFDVGLTTFEYEGGAIYPGINLSLDALRSGTSKLPKVLLQEPRSPIGKSTSEAINCGIYYGYSGMINSLVAVISQKYSEEFRIILTGGLSSLLVKYFNFPFQVDPLLTLKGIAKI